MEIIETKYLSPRQKQELFELWNKEYPRILNHTEIGDFESYLQTLEDHHHLLITGTREEIVGWYFDFLRDDKRWFLLIIDTSFQAKGYGERLLDLAKTKRNELHGWVIIKGDYKKRNGYNYVSPEGFYQKQGFRIYNNIRLEKRGLQAVKILWQRSAGFGNQVR